MARKELTVCDISEALGSLQIGRDWYFNITTPDGEVIRRVISLCGEHEGEVLDLIQDLEEYGREVVSAEITDEEGHSLSAGLKEIDPPREPSSEIPPPPNPPSDDPPLVEFKMGGSFYELLERVRLEKGVGANYLARKSGVARTTLLRWQKEPTIQPQPAQVSALTLELNLDRDEVYRITGVKVPEYQPRPTVQPTPATVSPDVPASGESKPNTWDEGLEKLVVDLQKRPSGSPVMVSNPDWVDKVRARCLEPKATGETDAFGMPVLCRSEMGRDQMAKHAFKAHEAEFPGELTWELIDMPEGISPLNCEVCTVPLPTVNSKTRHEMKCPVRRKQQRENVSRTRIPKAVEPAPRIHMEGRSEGTNARIGAVTVHH